MEGESFAAGTQEVNDWRPISKAIYAQTFPFPLTATPLHDESEVRVGVLQITFKLLV